MQTMILLASLIYAHFAALSAIPCTTVSTIAPTLLTSASSTSTLRTSPQCAMPTSPWKQRVWSADPHPAPLEPSIALTAGTYAPQTMDDVMAIPWATCFVDGSCTMSTHHPLWRRASWSVLLTGPGGEDLCAVTGPVWRPLPPTSGAGELASADVALQLAGAAADPRLSRTMVTDYQTTVNLLKLSLTDLLQHGRSYVGILRDWQSHASWKALTAEHIKAHTGEQDYRSQANERVDQHCHTFAADWRGITEPEEREHLQRTTLAVKVVQFAGRALSLYPSLKELAAAAGIKRFGKLPRERVPAAADLIRPVSQPHLWYQVPHSTMWKCIWCVSYKQRKPSLQDRLTTECSRNHPLREVRAAATQRGHQVWIATGITRQTENEMVALCSRCGQYTTATSKSGPPFPEHCVHNQGRPISRAKREAKKQFMQGRHPDRSKMYLIFPSPPVLLDDNGEDSASPG